jgi:hypothetical protein
LQLPKTLPIPIQDLGCRENSRLKLIKFKQSSEK